MEGPGWKVITPHPDLQTANPVFYPFFQGGLVWVGEAGDSGRNRSSAEPLETKRLDRAKKRGQRKQAKHKGRDLLANVGVGGETDPSIKFVLGHKKSSWKSRNRVR